jgi:membrane protein implicated in regulation of membrane protease activity
VGVPSWSLWILLGVALAIGEIFTPGMFFLAPMAIAAVAAAIAAALGAGWVLSLIVFGIASVASLAFLRPIVRSHVRQPPEMRTGTAALVGARAVVVERVDGGGGRVKIGGEVWSARAYDEHSVIEPGARVQVAEIEGATALVYE